MARNNEPGMGRAKKQTSGSGKWSKYNGQQGNGDATWGKVDASAIVAALVAVTDAGGALLLGKTRTGGALVITVCDGDDRIKFYSTTREETCDQLGQITDTASAFDE